MIPQTVGREFDVGKVARVQCVKNDTLKDKKQLCFAKQGLPKEFKFVRKTAEKIFFIAYS